MTHGTMMLGVLGDLFDDGEPKIRSWRSLGGTRFCAAYRHDPNEDTTEGGATP